MTFLLRVWVLLSVPFVSAASTTTVSSTDGKLSLTFDATSGRLLSVDAASNSSGDLYMYPVAAACCLCVLPIALCALWPVGSDQGGRPQQTAKLLSRKAVGNAGWSVVAMAGVGDGAESATISTPPGGGLCVSRQVGPLTAVKGAPTVNIKDCFVPSAATTGRPGNAVEWTSNISSNAVALFSVQIGRSLSFAPLSNQGEQIWSGSDQCPVSRCASNSVTTRHVSKPHTQRVSLMCGSAALFPAWLPVPVRARNQRTMAWWISHNQRDAWHERCLRFFWPQDIRSGCECSWLTLRTL